MPTGARFADRTDAGRRLAAELVDRGVDADLVLAIPRGGLPLGRAVADELGVPLDIVVASKIGAPTNPELAIGAVTRGDRPKPRTVIPTANPLRSGNHRPTTQMGQL